MDTITTQEWMTREGLTFRQIDFVESLLIVGSCIDLKKTDSDVQPMKDKYETIFSDMRMTIGGEITYDSFMQNLRDNNITVNLNELFVRTVKQGSCIKFCKKLQQKDEVFLILSQYLRLLNQLRQFLYFYLSSGNVYYVNL